jgi:hypothetical protein
MRYGKSRLEVRITPELLNELKTAAKARGFASANAFIRAAISSELRSGETALDRIEQNLGATIDRLTKEFRGLHSAQQALFTLTDSLVRLFLTCVPEPSAEMLDQATAKAKLRYKRFLLSVAQGMKRHD